MLNPMMMRLTPMRGDIAAWDKVNHDWKTRTPMRDDIVAWDKDCLPTILY